MFTRDMRGTLPSSTAKSTTWFWAHDLEFGWPFVLHPATSGVNLRMVKSSRLVVALVCSPYAPFSNFTRGTFGQWDGGEAWENLLNDQVLVLSGKRSLFESWFKPTVDQCHLLRCSVGSPLKWVGVVYHWATGRGLFCLWIESA